MYEKLCGVYATLCLLVLSCVDKLDFGLRARFEVVSYNSLVTSDAVCAKEVGRNFEINEWKCVIYVLESKLMPYA